MSRDPVMACRGMAAMSATLAQSSAIAAPAANYISESRIPICFVIDGDASIRHFLSLILHGAGIDTEEFADGHAVHAAVARRMPDLIFLNIPLELAEAIECVWRSAAAALRGHVQLMSNRGSAVLAHVKSIGEQHRLQMLPVLQEAVRDQRDRQDPAGPQARPSAGDCRPHRSRRGLAQELDRILVPAEDRSAQEATGRRRSLCPRAPSGARRAAAGRVHARRQRVEPDHAVRAGLDAGAERRPQFRQARRQSADRGQHPRQRAGQARGRRNREELSRRNSRNGRA